VRFLSSLHGVSAVFLKLLDGFYLLRQVFLQSNIVFSQPVVFLFNFLVQLNFLIRILVTSHHLKFFFQILQFIFKIFIRLSILSKGFYSLCDLDFSALKLHLQSLYVIFLMHITLLSKLNLLFELLHLLDHQFSVIFCLFGCFCK
jgi:hypothetical protein